MLFKKFAAFVLVLAGPATLVSAPVRAADAPNFAGIYVGHPTLLEGSCTQGPRLRDIIIDSRGNARLLYSMSSGAELRGSVDPNGSISMDTLSGTGTLRFTGKIQGTHLSGHSTYNDDHTCELGWEMDRQRE